MGSHPIVPFLVAFFAGLLRLQPTNVYQICRRGVGTLEVEPWLTRVSDALRSVMPSLDWFARLWRSRIAFACAAVLLAVLTAQLASGQDLTVSVAAVAMIPRSQLETELKEATNKAKTVMTAAENEKRELTEEERKGVQSHLDEAKRIKASIDRIDGDEEMRKQIAALGAVAPTPAAPGADATKASVRKSIGQLFIESSIWQACKAGKHMQQGFSESMEIDATLLDESAGSGGKLVLPDYQPGILPLLFRAIRITQLLAPGTTNSNSVEYMKETTFTNLAAARAEGAPAAESTLVFDRVADPVRSIAHWLPVTMEMLEDQSQTQSYVDARLRLGLDLAEEDQLLNGDGIAPNLTGLRNRAGLAGAVARGADTNADAIFKQIMAIATNAFVFPDGIAMHPTNWQTIVLSKDGNGQYYGQGPFAQMSTPVLWGLPTSVTTVQPVNEAFVGAYRQCAQRFVRRGGTVTATNSHSDYFIKRLVAIMAEMREALAVYRPAGFGKVTGLN